MKQKIITLIIILSTLSIETLSQLEWDKSGYTTISGEIQNFEEHYYEYNTIEVQIDDWTNAFRRTVFTEIDSSGRFSLSFFVFQTQEVSLNYMNEWRYVFVTPDDTLKVIIEAGSFRKTCSIAPEDSSKFSYNPGASFYGLKYDGITGKICQNNDHYFNSQFSSSINRFDSENKEKMAELNYRDYNIWRDSIYYIQTKELKEFLDMNSYEGFFDQYIESRYYLSYVYDLFNYYSMLNDHYQRNDSIRIRNSLELINSKMIQNQKVLTANPESYFTVVNNHINGLIREIGNQKFRAFYDEALENSEINEQKEKITPLNELSSQEYEYASYPFILSAADAIVDDRTRESLIAHTYTMILEYKNIDPGLELALSRINNEEVKASLINAHNHFLWRISNLSAINADPVGDTLLNYLKNKYKDNVLYIDFWGTWCGPCYGTFEAIPALKERLEGKDIVYIYLCCHCNKEKWEQDIETYQIEGEHILLSSEQYAFLANKFNLIGVPKFIIIDKQGRIVNDRAPRPVNHPLLLDDLVNELSIYLN